MMSNKYFNLLRLMGNEKRPPDRIRRLQDRKLRTLVAHAAANVPFYRDFFRQAGIAPADIQGVADLSRLPVVDKETIRHQGAEAFLDMRIKDTSRLVAVSTSGSSGRPFTFWVDRRYEALRKAQFLRPYLTNGRKLSDRCVILSMRESLPPKWFNRIGLLQDCAVYAGAAPDEQLRVLQHLRPAVIMGYGSVLAFLASHILESGGPFIRPRLVFTDSELLTRPMRRKIAAAFQVDPLDIYGTFETENIAYECACHEGYHIAEDCVIMETLREGRPVAPGEEGEIVCTVLDNYAMPFIRYNLYDIGSLANRPCSCGRRFALLNVIGGRLDDWVTLANGEKRSALPLSQGFDALDRLIREYQIIQQAPDDFRVRVVRRRELGEDLSKLIAGIIHNEFPAATVQVETVSHIAREASGKFRFFKSLVSGNGSAA